MFTMGDIARASTSSYGRKKLKKLFGINAKMLVDHAWGYEPCTISEAKSYTPESKSISSGQVLQCAYSFEKARVVVWEMVEQLSLDLVRKKLVTDLLTLTIGYDVVNEEYKGEITVDRYGRGAPKHAHGTARTESPTSSTKIITEEVIKLYDRITDKNLMIRRITICACNLVNEKSLSNVSRYEQGDLFTNYEELASHRKKEEALMKRERKIQETVIDIKERYGKNAIIKGVNLTDGATSVERNRQIGGHKA